MTCSTCETKAVLRVGDAICHRIQKSGGKVDCHGLAHQVQEKRLTVEGYVNELERNATSNEKEYVHRLRDLLGSQ
jgi:hypothetical protein